MTALSVRRGRESIVVWGRGRWQSMAHSVKHTDVGAIVAETRCGRPVILGEGVDRIALTSLPADLFVAVGCGLCSRRLLADLKSDLQVSIPDAGDRLSKLLGRTKWATIPKAA